jgi:hypothetical protein
MVVFDPKKFFGFSAVNFLQFWVIKPRGSGLDPDPCQMNTDPKHRDSESITLTDSFCVDQVSLSLEMVNGRW